MNPSCFATLRLQVDLSRRPGASAIAREVVAAYPGTEGVQVEGDGTISFEMLFPGNLSALATRLLDARTPVVGGVQVSIPVAPFTDQVPDMERVRASLIEGPEIWDVEFARRHYVQDASAGTGAVQASIVPTTQAMHQLYDAMLHLTLFADSHPAPRASNQV